MSKPALTAALILGLLVVAAPASASRVPDLKTLAYDGTYTIVVQRVDELGQPL